MRCLLSTTSPAAPAVAAADAYRLNPKVALRPEPFGALAYHFGNRRLSFLKEQALVEVVRCLGEHASVGDALTACDIPAARRASYLRALGSLVASDMIVPCAPAQPSGEQPAGAARNTL